MFENFSAQQMQERLRYYKKYDALEAKYGKGSRQRFYYRIWKWKLKGRKCSYLYNLFWWFIHNFFAHLAITFFFMFKWSFDFHDWTSNMLNPDSRRWEHMKTKFEKMEEKLEKG